MHELIYCCRHCLHVETTGVIVGSATTIETIQHYPVVAQCKRCEQFNCVPVNSTMASSVLTHHAASASPH
jgi:hypothetical protein